MTELVCGECGWRVVLGVFGLGAIIMEEHWKVSHAAVGGETP